jgi:hypothetical protein
MSEPNPEFKEQTMQWDDRLTPLGISVRTTDHAQWTAVVAQYQDEAEAQGQHHIWFTVLDQNSKPQSGVKVVVDWVGRDKDDPATTRVTDNTGKANVDI